MRAMCVWMCGTEYGGGGGDERRDLRDNDLTGPLPTELFELVNVEYLCVRLAPPPHLANAGLAATRGSLAGWVSRSMGDCGEWWTAEGAAVCTQLYRQQCRAHWRQDSSWCVVRWCGPMWVLYIWHRHYWSVCVYWSVGRVSQSVLTTLNHRPAHHSTPPVRKTPRKTPAVTQV